jgi:hypothetical protein
LISLSNGGVINSKLDYLMYFVFVHIGCGTVGFVGSDTLAVERSGEDTLPKTHSHRGIFAREHEGFSHSHTQGIHRGRFAFHSWRLASAKVPQLAVLASLVFLHLTWHDQKNLVSGISTNVYEGLVLFSAHTRI